MKMSFKIISVLILFLVSGCNSDEAIITMPTLENPVQETPSPRQINYLALGDSYTIGENVCETCRFPVQLKNKIAIELNVAVSLKIIARTGWTTTNLQSAINGSELENKYNLVTLLIGVNNQYQNRPFSLYEQEFPALLAKAIELAQGNHHNVLVISIPDYAYTPFGQNSSNPEAISSAIDAYNLFAQNCANNSNVTFINITDITRNGLENPDLVASDGLHPSNLAHAKFTERILPAVLLSLDH